MCGFYRTFVDPRWPRRYRDLRFLHVVAVQPKKSLHRYHRHHGQYQRVVHHLFQNEPHLDLGLSVVTEASVVSLLSHQNWPVTKPRIYQASVVVTRRHRSRPPFQEHHQRDRLSHDHRKHNLRWPKMQKTQWRIWGKHSLAYLVTCRN